MGKKSHIMSYLVIALFVKLLIIIQSSQFTTLLNNTLKIYWGKQIEEAMIYGSSGPHSRRKNESRTKRLPERGKNILGVGNI